MEILDNITNVLGKVSDFVWGVPLIVLILATGLLLTIRLKGIQITKLPRAIKTWFKTKEAAIPVKYPASALFVRHFPQPSVPETS